MIEKTFLLTVCLVGMATAAFVLDKPHYDLQDAENLFRDYVKEYKKQYSGKEYSERLDIFKANLIDINNRNAMFPETVFKANRFADMRADEFARYLGFTATNGTRVKVTIPDTLETVPDEFDWRTKGVVSHVKDQGSCGSCYIFSAIGNIEGQYALKHNECIALSEGQALDCLDCGTCSGGLAHEVMQELAKKAGVMKELDYPYKPATSTCHQKADKAVAKVTVGSEINIPDEDVLQKKLVEIGPLAVSLNALDFPWYHRGILKPSSCTGLMHNHAVVLVGYGEEQGTKFWIIKNSWSETWGEKGYVRLLRGVNACAMGTSYTASATVA